ncbi:MAG: hypothetical protein AAFY19_06735 [Pseudomonadota bacterium]
MRESFRRFPAARSMARINRIMGMRYTIPIFGILLACVTFVALLLLGLDPIIALAILFVWIGSLLVAGLRPPEKPSVVVKPQREDGTLRKMIENFSTPLLVTQRGTISIANRAARRMLGQHIIGQDARVAFRQPEAIHLLADNRSGTAMVRGLVRRQDVWQFNRHMVDDKLAVLELINQTAEAELSAAPTPILSPMRAMNCARLWRRSWAMLRRWRIARTRSIRPRLKNSSARLNVKRSASRA